MLRKNKKTNTPELTEAIQKAHADLKQFDIDTPAYAAGVDQIVKLYGIKDPKVKDSVQLKDWIPVIGAMLPVVAILVFESRDQILTSKALSFVPKLRA